MSAANILGDEPQVVLWTREGFVGEYSIVVRPSYGPDYLRVQGPHAPRRAVIGSIGAADETDANALPTVIATSKAGLRLAVSGRRKPMPFVVRNVEADELHFIQAGKVRFETEVGVLTAEEGDFVSLPKAIAYRFSPVEGPMRSLIIESPWVLGLRPPHPFGMINLDSDVHRAKVEPAPGGGGETSLVMKTGDGEVTTFVLPHDPLALVAHVGGSVPVWKLNIGKINVATYLPSGGPPSQFLSSPGAEICMFPVSARTTNRPPPHVNADYDEVILYVRGPAPYGENTEPGSLTWVPKGVMHHGPEENVPEGYQAWLLETKATLRWTAQGIADSELMETSNYGRHPSANR